MAEPTNTPSTVVVADLRDRVGLDIQVTAATGVGPTVLAAFDDALMCAGVSNFNLVRLSSMIPPGSSVSTPTRQDPVGAWGDRLYAVWAFQSAELLGQEAWAGISWIQDPADGRGVFVEHEGGSELQVREELHASIESLRRAHRLPDVEAGSIIAGTRCERHPACALVIAPMYSEPWH